MPKQTVYVFIRFCVRTKAFVWVFFFVIEKMRKIVDKKVRCVYTICSHFEQFLLGIDKFYIWVWIGIIVSVCFYALVWSKLFMHSLKTAKTLERFRFFVSQSFT